MASGLDNLFATYGNDYGALGAMQAGRKRGLADMATQLSNERSAAETSRYTAQTPDSNRVMAAQATSGELGNLQGQADQAAGVHGVKADQGLAEAQLKAKQAQATLKALPLDVQKRFHTEIAAGHKALYDNLEQILTQTGDVNKAVEYIESNYPDSTKDKGWAQAKQQYKGLSVDQILKDIRAKKAKLASSDAYGDPKFQGDMIKQDALLTSQERQQGVQANATLGAAQARGSAETKPTTEQFVYAQLQALYPNESPQQIAKRYIEYKTIQTKMQAGIVPELDTSITTTKGGPGGQSGTGSKVIKLD